jgi:formylglycine-generating enzyme required for sulfatase activity
VAFCHWLTEQLREIGELDAEAEVELPNELQWEKAARGTDGRTYPWGDEADPERANYGDTGIGTTSAAGCFPGGASPYGAEDLSGNVLEYVSDGRVFRGGSFLNDAAYVRCASRSRNFSFNPWNNYGFRVVASPVRSDL